MFKILLFGSWAMAAQKLCFSPYLPFLYGTENADTEISVAKQYDYDGNNLIVFLGGNTYDGSLTESTGTAKRAWVAR